MSSISGVSSLSNAWATAATQRNQMQAKMFNKVDADSSGGVDQAELQTMFTDISKKTGTTLDATELFTNVDTDANGSLSSEELATGMQSVMPPPPSTMVFAQTRSSTATDDLFSKVDANSDGSVDETEMTAFTDKMKTETRRDSTSSFSELDTDSDGLLSQAEFDAGKPSGPPGGMQGAGGPPAASGAGRPSGAQATESTSSSTTYDALDTNEDGTVSEMERLAGALKDFVNAGESSTATSTVDENILKLAQLVYEQIASGTTANSTSTLDATA